MEELDDFMNRKRHVLGILEGVIGAVDGKEFNDVVFGKGAGIFDGDHLICRAVQDEHAVGEIEVLVIHGAERSEIIEEGLVDLHFPLETDLDLLAFPELGVVSFGDTAAHCLIHADGRAAQGNPAKLIALLYEITERQVAAEAG